MCTLLIASRVWEEVPLLIAANRDENLDRPAAPPALAPGSPLPVLAPRDLKEGGTWLGLNVAGLFAAITNRFGPPRDPTRASRGALVLEALSERHAPTAADRVAALPACAYNPFHLVVADRERAILVWSDGLHLHRAELGPGFHVVTERSLGAAASGREEFLGEQVQALAAGPIPTPQVLRCLLSLHRESPFDSPCVHLPELRYGTRSSTLLWLMDAPAQVRFLHADGPPCRTAYADLSPQAEALLSGRCSQT
jgi:uncharacterized protein with NRDE domain